MNLCPVCGFPMRYPPRDWHICPSCGTEFGYDDVGRTFHELRLQWLASGPRWWSPVDPVPGNWNPFLQMIIGVYANQNPVGIQPSEIIDEARRAINPDASYFAPSAIVRNRARKRHYRIPPDISRYVSRYPALEGAA